MALNWDIDIKIISNKIVMKQIFMAFGIPCLALFVFISVLSLSDGVSGVYGYFESILPVIYISAALLAAPFPIILIFFRNRYPFTFSLNEKTASMLTRKKQRGKNRIVSNLLIFLGLVSGKPGAVGTGLINKNNNDVIVKLSQVKTVKFMKKDMTVLLKVNLIEKVYLFCTEDNYDQVVKFIEGKIGKKATLIYV